jgi:hypothetical protein
MGPGFRVQGSTPEHHQLLLPNRSKMFAPGAATSLRWMPQKKALAELLKELQVEKKAKGEKKEAKGEKKKAKEEKTRVDTTDPWHCTVAVQNQPAKVSSQFSS